MVACALGKHLGERNVIGTEESEEVRANGAGKDQLHSYCSLV